MEVPQNSPQMVLPHYVIPNYSIDESFLALSPHKTDQALPIIWSKTNEVIIIKDLAELKNLIIIGPPSCGKSIFIHQVIVSILKTKHPVEIKFILFDFKKFEFSRYNSLKNHFLATIPGHGEELIISDIDKAHHTLNAVLLEIESRFEILQNASCRNVEEYNSKISNHQLNFEKGNRFLPRLMLIIDELADLHLVNKNETNKILEFIARSGYKVGVHLIISTNQVLGDTLTSDIKSHIPNKIVFKLTDKSDNRKFFESDNLPNLNAEGQFLYMELGKVKMGQVQTFESTLIETLIRDVYEQEGFASPYNLPEYLDNSEQ